MTEGRETWRNVGNGMVYVLKNDRFGGETHELVNPGKSFSITTEERIMNMDRAATKDLDAFRNGQLVPVRLLDGDEEAQELASSPNLMAESDMEALFRGHWKTFESKIAGITNEQTLHRLMEVAKKVDATVRQVGIIETRIDEVAPKKFTEREAQVVGGGPTTPLPDREDTTGNPVSPK